MGAKFTGDDIAPDEHAQPLLDFDYEGKRDRWNGYDLSDHKAIAEEFQKIDEVSETVHFKKYSWRCIYLLILG